MDRTGGRTIRHYGGILEGMAQIGENIKIPIKGTLGKTGEYTKVNVRDEQILEAL